MPISRGWVSVSQPDTSSTLTCLSSKPQKSSTGQMTSIPLAQQAQAISPDLCGLVGVVGQAAPGGDSAQDGLRVRRGLDDAGDQPAGVGAEDPSTTAG
jgi:hypothetical protein